MERTRTQALRDFVEILVMRLEMDYDSLASAVLILVVISLGAVNPFLPVFSSVPPPVISLPVITVLQAPDPIQRFFELNTVFDSFILSGFAALALLFKNLSFGAVGDIRDGTMSTLILMPGGRKAVFSSVIVSSALLPYLVFSIPVLTAMALSDNSPSPADALLIVGFNFLAVMGLASVTLWTGIITRSPARSFGYGMSYLVVSLLPVLLALRNDSVQPLLMSALLTPSLSASAYVLLSDPAIRFTSLPTASDYMTPTLIVMLVAGLVFNTLIFYLLYYYWTRRASF